jgi:hypothetical protein
MGAAVTAGAPVGLPELGPLLGGLVTAPVEQAATLARLDPVRLDLLTALFDKAGAARALLAAGDAAGARKALGPDAWLEVWEQAVTAAAHSVEVEVERRLRDAALLSRYPRKRLTATLPDAEERRLLAARLSAAGSGLEATVGLLADPARPWDEALRLVTGELQTAWERLTNTALQELDRWERRASEIRLWRRPWLPLILTGAGLLLLAGWLGLVLGGYLTVPDWLRPAAEWVWNL